MSQAQQDPFKDALGALAEQRDDTLSDARLDAVYQRVEAELESPKRAKPLVWRLAFAGGLAASLALVGTWWLTWRPMPPIAQPTVAHGPRVILRSGEITIVDAEGRAHPLRQPDLPNKAKIRLAARARLDLTTPGRVRMVLMGPAAVQLRGDRGPVLTDGTAALSVSRRAAGEPPFLLTCGKATLEVTGTQLGVVMRQGKLIGVHVRDGSVRVRHAGLSREVHLLESGDSFSPRQTGAALAKAALSGLETAWWRSQEGKGTATGYLSTTSEPPGAYVWMDGILLGETPLLVRWPAGGRALRLTKTGYAEAHKDVSITPSRLVEWDATLVPEKEDSREPQLGFWERAEAALKQRRCSQLEGLVRAWVRKQSSPSHQARAWMLSAECYVRTGNKLKAIELYDNVVTDYSQTTSAEPALFEKGKLLHELRQHRPAIDTFDRYLKLYADGKLAAEARFRRCELLLVLGRHAEARHCLEQYVADLASSARVADAHFLLASLARVDERWKEAVLHYVAYLDVPTAKTRRQEAFYWRAVCIKHGNLPGLADAIDAYLAAFPKGTHANELSGWKK